MASRDESAFQVKYRGEVILTGAPEQAT